MKITIAGTGYVGLSLAVLLSQHNDVCAVDIIQQKIDMLNSGISPIRDKEIEDFLEHKHLHLTATTDTQKAYTGADFVIISTPTNYDPQKNHFDTSSVEAVIQLVKRYAPQASIVIKSTVPVGYTRNVSKNLSFENILFSPEFLREGHALYDNLYPSRIVIGIPFDNELLDSEAKIFANLLQQGAVKKDVPVLYTRSTEAEAIKLFANTYLALRISYFNELDTYAEVRGLDASQIIRGVSLDPRIGDGYNNPSFGYGGYCLPKDSKQLRANYADIPQNLISATVASNSTRKEYIARRILEKKPNIAGVYRLAMKTNSDNFRQSSIQDIMKILRGEGVEVVIYEPSIKANEFQKFKVIHDIEHFKSISDIILANRVSTDLLDVRQKIYTRDIYGRD